MFPPLARYRFNGRTKGLANANGWDDWEVESKVLCKPCCLDNRWINVQGYYLALTTGAPVSRMGKETMDITVSLLCRWCTCYKRLVVLQVLRSGIMIDWRGECHCFSGQLNRRSLADGYKLFDIVLKNLIFHFIAIHRLFCSNIAYHNSSMNNVKNVLISEIPWPQSTSTKKNKKKSQNNSTAFQPFNIHS